MSVIEQAPEQQQYALIYDAANAELADLQLSVIARQVLCNRIARAVLAKLPAIEAAQGIWSDS